MSVKSLFDSLSNNTRKPTKEGKSKMAIRSLFTWLSNKAQGSAKEGKDKMSTLFSMKKNSLSILCALVLVLSFNLIPAAADGIFEVESFVRITDVEGSTSETFLASEFFGNAAANIGDLDGDGITDLAVGAQLDDTGGLNKGALLILFMNANGTVESFQKISDAEGGLGSGVLNIGDMFGCSVADIGDFDGDGTTDLAVGACGGNKGRIFILFMNADGTVKSHQKITAGVGGFTGVLFNADNFGVSVADIGDLDGDGTTDIAVGAAHACNLAGYSNGYRGAVWILFMNTDGTVDSFQKITDEEGGFGGVLNSNARFGSGIANMGDLDGDGTTDLAVGAQWLHDGANYAGAVFILFMNDDGTVASFQKISNTQGGLGGVLSEGDSFGFSVANMGDLDGDGTTDLAVGAYRDSTVRGAVYILLLNADGTVNSFQKLPATGSSLDGVLTDYAQWGTSVANMGDLDGNGSTDLAVGARQPGTGMNGVYILFAKAADSEGPITSNVVANPNPAPVGTAIDLAANVDDSTTGGSDIASAQYNIDGDLTDMSADDGDFDEVSEDVEATIPASAFTEPGVHDVCVRGTDAAGNPGDPECIFLAVYDPTAGFVTGGGWIWSPEGAYHPDETLTGKATFGFVSKYKKGAQIPEGQTEFVFKAADLNFHSDSYDWLVVAGAKAMFKGIGTINGEGEYKFMLTGIDADINENDSFEVDRFRIKIWSEDESGNETVVYDNALGDDSDDATTEIGGGSIVIHTKK